MADYDGPERYDETDDSTVKFKAHGPRGGTFTVYLEPGESLSLADDDPNAVEVSALEVTDV